MTGLGDVWGPSSVAAGVWNYRRPVIGRSVIQGAGAVAAWSSLRWTVLGAPTWQGQEHLGLRV